MKTLCGLPATKFAERRVMNDYRGASGSLPEIRAWVPRYLFSDSSREAKFTASPIMV